MPRRFRFTIGRLMAAVLVSGIGFAALSNAGEGWAGLMLLLTLGAIAIAVAGAISREPARRAGWLGFALFGGGYLILAYLTTGSSATLPTLTVAQLLETRWRKFPPIPGSLMANSWASLPAVYRIVHCLWALGLAGLGSLLALGLTAGAGSTAATTSTAEATADEPAAPRRWRLGLLGSLAAFWVLVLVAVIRNWPAPGLWAGASFLVACGVLGLAVVGAVLGRGRVRETALAAAIFGFGYLALSYGQPQFFELAPHLPTEAMINRFLRAAGPPVYSGFPDFTTEVRPRVLDEYIRRKLEEPILMHFPNETPLDEVLKYIKQATREGNFPGFPIFVDPAGLQGSGHSLNSTVQIDLDAVPLRVGLRLILKQLGLSYIARQGYIMITSEDSATLPAYDDPGQVVGHSLLALVAAGIGAIASRLVSDRLRGTAGQDRAPG